MDLVELIETRRFLGSEFLTWLWFKSELYDGRFNVPNHDACEVWFDDRLTLEALIVENEQSQLKGASPSVSPEAREALRQGKLPTQAKLRILVGEQEFSFTLKGREFQLAGLKIPALMSEEEDEKFYERMYLIEEIESVVANLYGEFLALRLSPSWGETLVPWMRAWIQSESLPTPDMYRVLLNQYAPIEPLRKIVKVNRDAAASDQDPQETVQNDGSVVVDAAPRGLRTQKRPAAPASEEEELPADLGTTEDGEPIMPPAPF